MKCCAEWSTAAWHCIKLFGDVHVYVLITMNPLHCARAYSFSYSSTPCFTFYLWRGKHGISGTLLTHPTFLTALYARTWLAVSSQVATTARSREKDRDKDKDGLLLQIKGTNMIRKLCRVVMNLEQVQILAAFLHEYLGLTFSFASFLISLPLFFFTFFFFSFFFFFLPVDSERYGDGCSHSSSARGIQEVHRPHIQHIKVGIMSSIRTHCSVM